MKIISCLALALLVLVGGCSDRQTKVEVPEAQPEQPLLPIVVHPQARFYIQGRGRTCSFSIDFKQWKLHSKPWSRMECGIDYTSYDMRVEYLGRGAQGDLYQFTVYRPYPEKEKGTEREIATQQTFEYTGEERWLYQQGDVWFSIRG